MVNSSEKRSCLSGVVQWCFCAFALVLCGYSLVRVQRLEQRLKVLEDWHLRVEDTTYSFPQTKELVLKRETRDVADCVCPSGSEAKEKWKNLRSVFVRHLKPPKSGAGTAQKKPYYLADFMQFTIPFIKTAGKPSGNLNETIEDNDTLQPQSPELCEQTQFTESVPTSTQSISQQHSSLPSTSSQSISQQHSSLPSTSTQSISQQHSSLPSTSSQSISQQHSSLPSTSSQSISQQHSSLPSTSSQSISQQHSSLPSTSTQSISQQQSSLPSTSTQSISQQHSSLPPTSTQSILRHQLPPATSNKRKRKKLEETQAEQDIAAYFKLKRSKIIENCDSTENSNKMFLLSLLSDVNKLNDNQRRLFKRRVLELIDDIMDQSSPITLLSTPSPTDRAISTPNTINESVQSNTATLYYESIPMFLSQEDEE